MIVTYKNMVELADAPEGRVEACRLALMEFEKNKNVVIEKIEMIDKRDRVDFYAYVGKRCAVIGAIK